MVCCDLGTELGEVLGVAGAARCRQQEQQNALHSTVQSLRAPPCSKAQSTSHRSAVPSCTLTPEPQLKANISLLLYLRKGLSLQKAPPAFFNYCFVQHPGKKKEKKKEIIVFSALSHIKEVIESK